MLRIFACVLIGLSAGASALAQDAPFPPSVLMQSERYRDARADVDPRAALAIELFFEACLKGTASQPRVAAWADFHKFVPVRPDLAANFLRGQQGMAWVVPQQFWSLAPLILAATDQNLCRVFAMSATHRNVPELLAVAMSEARLPAQKRKEQEPAAGLKVLPYYIRLDNHPVNKERTAEVERQKERLAAKSFGITVILYLDSRQNQPALSMTAGITREPS